MKLQAFRRWLEQRADFEREQMGRPSVLYPRRLQHHRAFSTLNAVIDKFDAMIADSKRKVKP